MDGLREANTIRKSNSSIERVEVRLSRHRRRVAVKFIFHYVFDIKIDIAERQAQTCIQVLVHYSRLEG